MNETAGPHSIVRLHAETGISRPALYRIMTTLVDLGYVRSNKSGTGFHLTHLVRALSIGFDEEHWIEDISRPILEDLQQEVVWPTDLSTYANGSMHLRQTTRNLSPWTIDRAAIGLRLPMYSSASGLAYLAHCSEVERKTIGSMVPPGETVGAEQVEARLERTRSLGYGERVGGLIPESSAIAIPIFDDRGVRGCLSITFIGSVLTPASAARRYLVILRNASERISGQLTRQTLSDLADTTKGPGAPRRVATQGQP